MPTYACLITEANVPTIIKDAAKHQLLVTPQYDREEAAEFGEDCVAILSVNEELNYATFTTQWVVDFTPIATFEGELTDTWKEVTFNR